MFNRKGVSEVVANVLIVLLVIVGIAVIWSVVKPAIDKGAQGVENAGDCFSVQVQPESCTANGANWDVVVKRNPGQGNFDNINIIFSDGTNTEREEPATAITQNDLGELETTTISIPDSNLATVGTPTEANIVLIAGNGQLCQVVTQAVNC